MPRTPDAGDPAQQPSAATGTQSGTDQPKPAQPSVHGHHSDQAATGTSSGGIPTTARPTSGGPNSDQSGTDGLNNDRSGTDEPSVERPKSDASLETAAGGGSLTGQAVWRSGDAARRAHPVAWRVTRVALLLLFLLGLGALAPAVPTGIVEWANPNWFHGKPIDEATKQQGVPFWAGGVLCFLVVLIAIWRLMDLIRHDKIFTSAASPWVNTIIVVSLAGALLFGVFAALLFAINGLGGALILTFAAGAFSVGAFMAVMRGVLREATLLRNDLEDVI